MGIVEADTNTATPAELITWQNHLQGQIEALRVALATALGTAAQDAGFVARIEAALAEWRQASADDPATEPAILDGFDGVRDQLLRALNPAPPLSH